MVTVGHLLDRGAYANSRNRKTTPLHYAASSGNIHLARHLLDYGADIGAQDAIGNTALHGAVRYEQVDIIRHLFDLVRILKPKFTNVARCYISRRSIGSDHR